MAPRTDTEVAPPPVEKPVGDTPPIATETHAAAPPPPSGARNILRTRPRARMLVIGAIVVVIVGAILAWRYFSSYETTDDAQVDGHLMPLSTRISGYVQKVNVDDNQSVRAGYVLAEIDPRDYEVAVEQAKANLADTEAQAQS